MSETKSSETKKSGVTALIAAIVVIIAVAVVALVLLKKKPTDDAAAIDAEITSTEEISADENDKPKIADNVVVETKKLGKNERAVPKPKTPPPVSDDPFVAKMMAPRGIGNPDAPIKVVEYSSLTCSHCAQFHNETIEKLKKDYIDTGKVYMTFREFPLNMPALEASMILRCLPEDKFYSFMALLFSEQDKWAYSDDYSKVVSQNAKLAGIDDDGIKTCLANEKLKEQIGAEMQYAQENFKVASTPSFVVNDGERVIVGSQPYEFFKETFDTLLEAKSATLPPATKQEAVKSEDAKETKK